MKRALADGLELDDDKSRIDRTEVHRYLGGESYWAKGRPRETQDRLIDLMAGTANPTESEARSQMQQDMIRVFEAQRLISLQTIFDLADSLEKVTKGQKIDTALVNKLAARISEIQLPRSSLSSIERNSLSFGYWSEKHIENQRKVNLRAAVDKAANDPEKLKSARDDQRRLATG